MDFIFGQRQGASVWSEYYVKEIIKAIDLAEPGDEIWIDVQEAVVIALRGEVDRGKIFSVDNLKNDVCVKLSKGRKTCFSYFNKVDVVILAIEFSILG